MEFLDAEKAFNELNGVTSGMSCLDLALVPRIFLV